MSTDVHVRDSDRRRSLRYASLGFKRLTAIAPAALIAVIFGFFLATKTSEALTALDSTRALLIIGAIAGGWVLIGVLMRRFVPNVWIRSAFLCAAALVLGFVLVLPYYVSTTDNTQLVNGPIQRSAGPTVQPRSPVASAPTPAVPVRVSAGSLHGLGHRATGETSVIRLPDGSFVVRFSTFDIEGTPDPHVYVVPGDDRRSLDGAIELATLRGNVGTASDYAVPKGSQPGGGWTVLVWCRSFDTPIANSTQLAS